MACSCYQNYSIDVVLRQGGRHLEHVLYNWNIRLRLNLCNCKMQIYCCYMSNKTLICLFLKCIIYFNIHFLTEMKLKCGMVTDIVKYPVYNDILTKYNNDKVLTY